MQKSNELIALSGEGTHEKIITYLQDGEKGELLDIPAGTGALSVKLKDSGFECYCCDITSEYFGAQGVEFKMGDLNNILPYETDYFDYVTCSDGLEHLENPHNAIREFSRILK